MTEEERVEVVQACKEVKQIAQRRFDRSEALYKQLQEAETVLKRVYDVQYEMFMKASLDAIPKDNIQGIQWYFDKYYGGM
jgi:hypothetical protein